METKHEWELSSSELAFDKNEESCLGRGGFGEVFRGSWRGQPVAIKQLLLKKLTSRARKEFIQEIDIASKLSHPSLVPLFGAVIEPNCVAMVMELMEGGSLYHLLQDDEKELSWLRRCKIMLDVACGVEYLHAHSIVHRDIKSLNILLNRELEPKLCDFGLAVIKMDSESQSTVRSQVGTVRWLGPEVMQGGKHSRRSDIWALGLVGVELATRAIPFAGVVEQALIANLSASSASNLPVALPEDCPAALACVLAQCQLRDPALRPEIADVVEGLRECYAKQCEGRQAGLAKECGAGDSTGHSQESFLSNKSMIISMQSVMREQLDSHNPVLTAHSRDPVSAKEPPAEAAPGPKSALQSTEATSELQKTVAHMQRQLEDLRLQVNTAVQQPQSTKLEGEKKNPQAVVETEVEKAARHAVEKALQLQESQQSERRKRIEEEEANLAARQQELLKRERAAAHEAEAQMRRIAEEEARLSRIRDEAVRAQKAAFEAQAAAASASFRSPPIPPYPSPFQPSSSSSASTPAPTSPAPASYPTYPPGFFTQHNYQPRRSEPVAASSGVSTGFVHRSNGSANGRELFQGPLGGVYYINSNGNKTYVRK